MVLAARLPGLVQSLRHPGSARRHGIESDREPMESAVASVRDDSIIGRKRGRFLRLWPLSLPVGAVSCAVCRRRYTEGMGAFQREEFSTSDNRSAAFILHGGRRQ